MRRIEIYSRDHVLLIYPCRRTDAGFYLSSAPYKKVEPNARDVGAALRDALAVEGNIATPGRADYPALARERYTAADVKNEASFMRGASLLVVTQDTDGFTIIPTRNGGTAGPNKGFIPHFEEALKLDRATEFEKIGVEILKLIRNET